MMTTPPQILIIDDEVSIRRLLANSLQTVPVKTIEADTARQGIALAASINPDLIILDLGLPDQDGKDTLKLLREWYSAPIIILSVRNNEDEIVLSLDLGANDYLTKPFRSRELIARIKSNLRDRSVEKQNPLIHFGEFTIDLSAHTLKKSNEVIHLTSHEYHLLSLLAQNRGRVLTHHFLLNEVWGLKYSDQNQYLRVFIGQLRKKIEPDSSKPIYLITEAGIGYRFSDL